MSSESSCIMTSEGRTATSKRSRKPLEESAPYSPTSLQLRRVREFCFLSPFLLEKTLQMETCKVLKLKRLS